MHIVIAGGTGLIGAAVSAQLVARGHQVTVLSRRLDAKVPSGVKIAQWTDSRDGPWSTAVHEASAVINLAGESIAGHRWDEEYKKRLRSSRIETTRLLALAVAESPGPPRFVSASATGYYGDRGDEQLTEVSGPGNDFLAKLCVDWEKEADRAADAVARVVKVRFGIVLDRSGGALKQMLYPLPLPISPWKLGFGGPIGSGRQWMSWIHCEDLANLLCWIVEQKAVVGPVNAVAPEPVRARDFARALGKVLRRPSFVPVPQFALHMILGELAESITASQRVIPEVALRAGFEFRYADLERALADLLRKTSR
jgi:uncharacterized protein (TIGR01777 family)